MLHAIRCRRAYTVQAPRGRCHTIADQASLSWSFWRTSHLRDLGISETTTLKYTMVRGEPLDIMGLCHNHACFFAWPGQRSQ